MAHVFPRHCHSVPPTAVSAQGCYITDESGKRYFDGSGGAAVSCLGHGNRDVIDAVAGQMETLAFAHTGFFTSQPAEELADLLVEHAPGDLDRVYFVSGGSEAVEAAIKLARQYFVETGKPNKCKLISRRHSYHGNTLGALAAGGNEWRRAPYAPLLIDVSHISPCFEYRGRAADEPVEAYGRRVADELQAEIDRMGADNVMAFIAEPVVGATLGAVPAVDGYFRRIREICDENDVLLILDEVMCGMGRTGSLFACEQDGVAPDIVTIAKGLGAGYQPIGAMMCTNTIYDAISQGSGFFQHGHTYIGHPAAAAAGLAVLKTLTGGDLLDNVNEKGDRLSDALGAAFGQHPHVGDIRGKGLFRGLEIVEDRETKQPFDPSLAIHARFKKAAFEAGLICYPMGGTVDGRFGDHVMLAPPFIMEDAHIDEIVSKLQVAMTEATGV